MYIPNVVGWGLLLNNGQWYIKPTKQYEDKETTVRNIYRFLVFSGRIGLILFVTDNMVKNETPQFFEAIGIKK